MGICFSVSARKDRIVPASESSNNHYEYSPRINVAARILPIDIFDKAPRPPKPHL